jgi:hypothetical protein
MSGPGRFTVGQPGQQAHPHQAGNKNPIQIDSRLQVKNQPNNSSFIMNKYRDLHQNAHETAKATGGLTNSTVNKSGQLNTSSFTRVRENKNHPNTQRGTNGHSHVGAGMTYVPNQTGRTSIRGG